MKEPYKVYEYQKCSTCKKAMQFLDRKKVAIERFAIADTPPTEAELLKMLKFLDGNLKKLFNTSGILYREMGISQKLNQKVGGMTPAEAIRLLSKNGMLVKRPFILGKNGGAVGFREAEWEAVLKG